MSVAIKKQSIADRLPSPSGVALRLGKIVDEPGTTLEDIVAAIQTDPAMASQIIRQVNSPINGMNRKIGSIKQAVQFLGFQAVKSLAFSFSLTANHRTGTCKGFDYERFWSHSLARAATARHFAVRRKGITADEAFTCGLLSKIGRLGFATVYSDVYGEAAHFESTEQLLKWEGAQFGHDHNELTANMLTAWNMPSYQIQAVKLQDSIEHGSPSSDSIEAKLANILYVSGLVSEIFHETHRGRCAKTELAGRTDLTGVPMEQWDDVLRLVGDEWISSANLFSIRPFSNATSLPFN